MFEDTPEELLPMVSESELYGQPSARQQDYQITDEQVEEVKSKLHNYRQKANNTYEQWEPTIISRYEKYQADPEYYARIFPRLSKLSSYTERDIANTIEWALPSIVDAFIATDDICDIKGVTAEDDHNAYVMKMLINYQLNKKNNSMQLIYNWAKDALILGIGLVKVQWLREEAIIEASEFMNQQSLMMAMQQGMEITGVQEAGPDTYNVFYNKPATIKNQPLIENLKFSEFRFLDGYKDLTACPFVAHVKQMTKSDLREKEKSGMYSNVSEAIDNATPNQIPSQLDTLITTSYNRVSDVMGSRDFKEESMNNVEVWESFVKIDIDGDGIAENWIITTVNDVIIRSERNVYGRHPFFILSPFDDPHTLIANQSYADIIGPIQDAKTALMKQLLNNIAQTNDPKTVIDEQSINIGDLITGKQYIRKKQGVDMNNAFQQFPVAPMHQATLAMYELLSGNNENRTGITRYNQGLDANTLNKTATGISAIMSASNQRLKLIVRLFAETGVKDLLLFMVQLNQKFYNQEQVIRLTNEELTIRPDDIQGQFDLTVSSGAGMATKEATAMNLKTFLDTQIGLKAQGIQCVTEENIYETMKKYLINLDYKNVDLFITEPSEVAMNEQLKMMAYQTLFSMLPPAFQMVVQEDLQRNGQLSPQVIQGLFQLVPSLPPQGQQLVQILFGGQQQNALQQPNTGGSFGSQPTSPNGAGQSSKNLSGYLSQSGATADNKAFVQHDIN